MTKTWTYLAHKEHFQAINRGEKRFECRRLNREVEVGDTLELVEVDAKTAQDTGGVLAVTVTHIQYADNYAIKDGFMIMSIEIY